MTMSDPIALQRPPASPRLLEDRLVAVVRARSAVRVATAVEVLIGAGIRTIELTLTTPRALETLVDLRSEFAAEADFGMGTITSLTQAQESLSVGAAFLVTPVHVEGVVELSARAGVPVFPGALTPTEIHRLWREGATAIKVFPASLVGPKYLSELRGPFPDVAIMPSGGVGISDIASWLEAGAVAVSLGGALLQDALDGDLEGLRTRAQTARDHVGRWADGA